MRHFAAAVLLGFLASANVCSVSCGSLNQPPNIGQLV